MLGFGSGGSGLLDGVSGRREFGAIAIYERVLDTDGRTINIDNIATISVGVLRYRLIRWLIWLAGAGFGLFAIGTLITAFRLIGEGGFSYATPILGWGFFQAAIAVGCYFLGRWFRDVNVLMIGASDGSRSVFRSRDMAYLREVRNFLTKKINEQDLSAKLSADFKEAVSRPVTQNIYGGTHVNNTGVMVAGDNNQFAYNSANAMVGDGQLRINGSGNRFGTQETSYAVNGSAGVQIGAGHTATGNQNSAIRIDFSGVLPQIVDLQRFYSQHQGMEHIEQRLTEMELLMRSGAMSRDQKSRMGELAADLGSILQSYPAMVQLFGHVGKLVGF